QAFRAEGAVETLDAAVLPRLAGLDRGGIAVLIEEPDAQCPGDELGTVVAAQHLRRPVRVKSPSSTPSTRLASSEEPTSIARHSRVHSSTTVNALSFCPFAQVSCT